MLTLPDTWAKKAINPNVKETWLVRLYYDAEGASDYIGLATEDIVVTGTQFYGVLSEIGDVHWRIDLARSRASTSDIEIECINQWKTTPLSKLLFEGTNKYLNRKVEIYSGLEGETTIGNYVQIYTGRVVGITHNQYTVNIDIEAKRPWDNIRFPQTRETVFNILQPIAYGSFAENTEYDLTLTKAMFPVPYTSANQRKRWHLVHKTLSSGEYLFYYDLGLDQFERLEDTDDGQTVGGIAAMASPINLERHFARRGRLVNGTDDDFTDTGNITDENDSNKAYHTSGLIPSTTSMPQKELRVYFDIPDRGKITKLEMHANYEIQLVTNNLVAAIDVTAQLRMTSWKDGTPSMESGDGLKATIDNTTAPGQVAVNTDQTWNNTITEFPDEIGLRWDVDNTNGDGTVEFAAWIYAIWFEIDIELDESDTTDARDVIDDKDLYVGADGLDKTYTDGSGTAELPHEIHRDLLKRFTDWDYADASMVGWTALNTARTLAGDSTQDWDCRWWTLRELELERILEQIQFEGCFIFLLRQDADGGKYVFVHDSYGADDVEETLDENDYIDLQCALTPLSDLMTDTDYNYTRKPSGRGYYDKVNKLNDPAKNAWFFDDENFENTKTFNLDFIASDSVFSGAHSSANDCVALYYDNISAEPKVLISCTIINKAKFGLQVGDIVKYSDTQVDPYNKTWSDLFFMIIEQRRGVNSMEILAREVYST